MIFAFNVTTVMYILNIIFYAASLFAIWLGKPLGIPLFIGITALILSILLDIFIIIMSQKLYRQTLSVMDYDFDEYLALQNKIKKRCRKFQKLIVDMNMIQGYIAYERFSEARTMLEQIRGQVFYIRKDKLTMTYFGHMLEACSGEKNAAAFNQTLNEIQNFLSSPHKLKPQEKAVYAKAVEIDILLFSFFTRTPQQLASTDRTIAENLQREYMPLMKNYTAVSNYHYTLIYYTAAVPEMIVGSRQTAEQYLQTVAQLPYTYPSVQRARQYLETGDIRILMK